MQWLKRRRTRAPLEQAVADQRRFRANVSIASMTAPKQNNPLTHAHQSTSIISLLIKSPCARPLPRRRKSAARSSAFLLPSLREA